MCTPNLGAASLIAFSQMSDRNTQSGQTVCCLFKEVSHRWSGCAGRQFSRRASENTKHIFRKKSWAVVFNGLSDHLGGSSVKPTCFRHIGLHPPQCIHAIYSLCSNLLEHDIDVEVTKPIKQYAYSCPMAKGEVMRKEFNYLLENSLARPMSLRVPLAY